METDKPVKVYENKYSPNNIHLRRLLIGSRSLKSPQIDGLKLFHSVELSSSVSKVDIGVFKHGSTRNLDWNQSNSFEIDLTAIAEKMDIALTNDTLSGRNLVIRMYKNAVQKSKEFKLCIYIEKPSAEMSKAELKLSLENQHESLLNKDLLIADLEKKILEARTRLEDTKFRANLTNQKLNSVLQAHDILNQEHQEAVNKKRAIERKCAREVNALEREGCCSIFPCS